MGGAEQIILMIIKSLLKRDFFVEVYFLKYFNEHQWSHLKSDNLKYFYFSEKSEQLGFWKFFLKMIFKKDRYYSLSFTSHISCTSVIGLLNFLNFLKVKTFIARESTSIFKRYNGKKLRVYKAFYWIGYRNIDILICQTKDMKYQLEKNLPYLSKRACIEVISNPIDLQLIKACEQENASFRNQSNIIRNIVTAGRLIPEKGFDILIESFKILLDSYSQNLNLYILGEGPDRDTLQSKINELNLHDKVFLEGYCSNVYPYFRKANLCVVSSRIEGFPNVLLQMMTQNEKVVSTLCAGGINEIPGIIVSNENNSTVLALAMKECLDKDTSSNRVIFDDYMKERDINKFIEIILKDVKQ